MNKKDVLLSKDNITRLYKQTLQESNLQGIPKKSQKIVADMLTVKMKEVYKSIDFSQVNKKNESQIFKQFNEICLKETQNEIRNSELFEGEDTQVARLKFNRDFNSGPERKVKFMERPMTVGSKINKQNKPVNQNNFMENSNELPGSLESYNVQSWNPGNQVNHEEDELGQFFTNPHNFNKNDQDQFAIPMPKKLDEMTKERQIESQTINKRPPTPDFLKPVETQERKESFDMVNSSMNQNNYLI